MFIAGLSLTWTAFFQRETDLGIRLTKIDEALRFILIPALLIVAVTSLLGQGPLAVGEGALWRPAKITVYSLMLVIGLGMRFIMRAWTTRFHRLAEGPNPQEEAALKREIDIGRGLAYVYWIGIASVALLGAKPF